MVKNKVTIGDGLIQGTKVVDHALQSVTVVADTEVALLEDAKLGVVAERETHGCRVIGP
jgi:hypothetical protein